MRSLVQENCYGLDSLAKAHVVGKAGANAPDGKALHPLVALALVFAQICPQKRGHSGCCGKGPVHALDIVLPLGIHLDFHVCQGLLHCSRSQGVYLIVALLCLRGHELEARELAAQIRCEGHVLSVPQGHETASLKRIQKACQGDHLVVVKLGCAGDAEPVVGCPANPRLDAGCVQLTLELQAHALGPLKAVLHSTLAQFLKQGQHLFQIAAEPVAVVQPLGKGWASLDKVVQGSLLGPEVALDAHCLHGHVLGLVFFQGRSLPLRSFRAGFCGFCAPFSLCLLGLWFGLSGRTGRDFHWHCGQRGLNACCCLEKCCARQAKGAYAAHTLKAGSCLLQLQDRGCHLLHVLGLDTLSLHIDVEFRARKPKDPGKL